MIKEQKEILKIIADFVSENLDYDIRKKSQKKEYVSGRWIYIKLAKTLTTANLTNIGREVNIGHASVINSIRRIHSPSYFTTSHEIIYGNYYNTLYDNYEKIRINAGNIKKDISNLDLAEYYENKIEKLVDRNYKLKMSLNKHISRKNYYKNKYLELKDLTKLHV